MKSRSAVAFVHAVRRASLKSVFVPYSKHTTPTLPGTSPLGSSAGPGIAVSRVWTNAVVAVTSPAIEPWAVKTAARVVGDTSTHAKLARQTISREAIIDV